MEYDELVKFLEGCKQVDAQRIEHVKDYEGDPVTLGYAEAKLFAYGGNKTQEDEIKSRLAFEISKYIEGKSNVLVRMMPKITYNFSDEQPAITGKARIIAY